MSKFVEVKLQHYPTNLIEKDWSQRCIKYRANSENFLKKIQELEVFDDDVWLVTWPKCGTTWMQELLWLVLADFDFEMAKRQHLEIRSPFLEFDYMINEDLEAAFKPIELLPRPRLIKTHLCLPLLPVQIWTKKPKVIYVARNLKDACVSSYYHCCSLGTNKFNNLEESVISYMERDNASEPFLHLTEFYSLRNEPWLYYTSFERMKLDLRQIIMDVSNFLNKTITEENMKKMLRHLSFEEMKINPKTNHHWEFDQYRKKFGIVDCEKHNFVRKGLVNGYKEELSPQIIDRLDKWVAENFLKYNVTMEELLLLK